MGGNEKKIERYVKAVEVIHKVSEEYIEVFKTGLVSNRCWRVH
jgi:hypothetical protein